MSFVQPIRGRLRWFTVGALGALAIAQLLSRTISGPMFPRLIGEPAYPDDPAGPHVWPGLVTLLVRSLEVTVKLWRPVILGAVVGVLWIPMLVSLGRLEPRPYPTRPIIPP